MDLKLVLVHLNGGLRLWDQLYADLFLACLDDLNARCLVNRAKQHGLVGLVD